MGTSFAESEEPLFSSCFFLGFAEWIRNLTKGNLSNDKEMTFGVQLRGGSAARSKIESQ